MKDRKRMLTIIFAAVALIAVIWSFTFMVNEEVQVADSRKDLQRCNEIASQLEKLQAKPRLASDHEQLSSETTGLIERAARNAQIAASSIERITPQPAKKIPNTSYKEKPTSLTLREITLRQLVTMAKNLSNAENNLTIKSIKLTPPNDKDTGNKWNVKLVLSYLIYDQDTDK